MALMIFAGGISTQACASALQTRQARTKKDAAPISPPQPTKAKDKMTSVEVLKEGVNSSVKDPFIIVVYDAETYRQLKQAIAELPEVADGFFEGRMICAAFLGGRRTGGYGIEINVDKARTATVREKTPPAGAMTTQALTSPYKIVAVSLDHTPAAFDLGPSWTAAMRPYRVSAGEYAITGGTSGMMTGRRAVYKLAGEIGVMRWGKLASFDFKLRGDGGEKANLTQALMTCALADQNQLVLHYKTAASSSPTISDALDFVGELTMDESKLKFTFSTGSAQVAGGFTGSGQLAAEATAPPPRKTKSPMREEPM